MSYVLYNFTFFLACKIFTVYINDMLNFKCQNPGPKGCTKSHVLHNVTFFLACKIFTVYIKDVLNFKCPTPGPKG
jgi:uncharacterized membrane protein